MKKKCKYIRVRGKVQGVWYRASTRIKARELGLTGTVRNLPDGSVYIEAEGRPEALNWLVDWCWQGPPHAVVEAVEAEETALRHFDSFDIIR